MEKHILSKSTFIKGYHCLKSLYLHKKRPFLRDRLTAEQLAKFKRGHQVGDLAQKLFPGGIDVSPKSPSQYQKSAVRTGDLIEQGQDIIYEATFQFNKVLVMLDLLVKTKDGWDAYEVKSSKSLSETYFTDAALQYYVIENSGLKINKFYLVYVDQDYRLKEELNIEAFFIKQNVTNELIPMQAFIGNKIAEEMQILQEKHSPKVDVGEHCFSPYKCDFVGFCWKKIANKPYLPKQVHLSDTLPEQMTNAIPLCFIFSEQAIPECKNEVAYFQKCIGFKVGDGKVSISGKTCEEKRDFYQAFFTEIDLEKSYFTHDSNTMNIWLDDLTIQFPEFVNKINHLTQNTVGLLESLEKANQITAKERVLYGLAALAKEALGDNSLQKAPVYSDILATALYQKMEPNLWADSSPDIEILQNYLDQKIIITRALFNQE